MKALALLALLLLQGIPAAGDKGVVTGLLRTADGMPAAGIRVAVTAVGEAGAMLSIAETDKDGRYRLENIPPGRNYITAGLVDVPTYFPGTLTPATAAVVQVLAGKTLEEPSFSMLAPLAFKVSGRFVVMPGAASYSIVLIAPDLRAIETPVRADGTFEFVKVKPCDCTLLPYFGLPALPLRVTDHDITNIELGAGPGVRVSGLIRSPSSPADAVPPQTIALTGGPHGTSLLARNASNGSFEFLRVPPGNYSLRVMSGPVISQPVTLVVADKDMSGFEIIVRSQSDLRGRIVNEDGSRFQIPGKSIDIEARSFDGRGGTAFPAIDQDGSFTFRLAEGDYQIALRNVPLGLVVKAISYAGSDILKSPLKISAGQIFGEIVVTVATVPLESISGVRLSGRVVGLPPARTAGARVVLSGTERGTPTIETTPNPDGSFEFAKVPPGNYFARVVFASASERNSDQRMSVGTNNISGVELPVTISTTVSGRVIVVDANGRPVKDMLPESVTLRRGSGYAIIAIPRDGTFSVLLDDGDLTISFDRLSPQFTIQSITAGSTDLMKVPLKVDWKAPPPEIEVRMEYRKP